MQYNIVLKYGNNIILLQIWEDDYEYVKEAINRAEDIDELWDLLENVDYTANDYVEMIEFY